MLEKWLKASSKSKKYSSFTVVEANEIKSRSKTILAYLGEETLNSYRIGPHLKRSFSAKKKKELKEYLKNIVFPPTGDPFNVRQGDFGETLARIFIEKFSPHLKVPCYKLRWKFNNSKSVFCTDVFAHNVGTTIKDLKYYEVKTKINSSKTSLDINGKKESRHIGVVAHEGLAKDEQKISNDFVADFLKRLYEDKAQTLEDHGDQISAEINWNIALQYQDIVLNPQNYKRSFELVLIIEKEKYSKDILDDLQSLPPSLNPLDVTVILIENLQSLVDECIDMAIKVSIKQVYGK